MPPNRCLPLSLPDCAYHTRLNLGLANGQQCAGIQGRAEVIPTSIFGGNCIIPLQKFIATAYVQDFVSLLIISHALACRFCGYEVTTEGDSFTIAFHDAFDAVAWALATQRAMLEAEWPQPLLAHEKAALVYSSMDDSTRPGELVFRGLRVRMAITTGKVLFVCLSWDEQEVQK